MTFIRQRTVRLSTLFALSLVLVFAIAPVLATNSAWGQGRDRPLAHLFRRSNPSGPASFFQVDPDWPRAPESVQAGAVSGIAIGEDDSVWVYTRGTPPVQRYSSTGDYLGGWGSELIGKAHGIRIGPDGDLWLTDIGRHVVHRCSTGGEVRLTLGTLDEPGNDATHFDQPTDVALTPDGEVYVADGYGNNRVVRFDINGNYLEHWGEEGSGPGQFKLPHAIARDSTGRIYVADRSNARIQVFDAEGRFLDQWRDVVVPWGLSVTPDDRIWVCGSSPMPRRPLELIYGCPPHDQLLLKFTPAGRLEQLVRIPMPDPSDSKPRPGTCNWVHTLAVDSRGDLYAGDIVGQRAQKFRRID